MKKTIVALVVAASFSLTGCGGSDDAKTTTGASAVTRDGGSTTSSSTDSPAPSDSSASNSTSGSAGTSAPNNDQNGADSAEIDNPSPSTSTTTGVAPAGSLPKPSLPSVDQTSPESVANAWVQASQNYDAFYDSSDRAALLRARPLAGGLNLAQINSNPDTGVIEPSIWTSVQAHKARSSLKVTPQDNGSRQSGNQRDFTYLIERTWVGSDGWTMTEPAYNYVLVLNSVGSKWEVTGASVIPSGD